VEESGKRRVKAPAGGTLYGLQNSVVLPACASDNRKRRKRNYVEDIGRGVKTRSVAISFGRKFCQGVGRVAMSFVLDLDLVSLPKPSGSQIATSHSTQNAPGIWQEAVPIL
jgi:hypothetical protein